ncbi:inositol monophosphatase family protein [Rubritalea marina]|uniref:inositol monophosphatase family protein n=1 Tax=Rubritalea marina TaxID=361055 RepID=UPI000382CABD|nr:inositol monophosphatase family protein [Rubritalea marina]
MTYIEAAVAAVKASADLIMGSFGKELSVDEAKHHDIKLALDRESQDLITSILLKEFPDHALYGEEGIAGNQDSDYQWIVDPIDGTVNYFYGIPHFCISVALRHHGEIILGVIFDPVAKELWTVEQDGPAFLNGEVIQASPRTKLEESILYVGCGKTEKAMETGLPRFKRASLRARKMRMMGSAALATAYVATGRLDAYVEARISLWDIAAGKLLIEAAGGVVELQPIEGSDDAYSIIASNGKIPIEEIL